MHRTLPFAGLAVVVALGISAAGGSGGSGGSAGSVSAPAQGAAGRAPVRQVAPGTSFRFPAKPAAAGAAPTAAPLSLTASDGTGLALVALAAEGVLEPPLAFTELHLTFDNPRDRVIEGRFRIALPPGAALSRLAMKTAGGWQEGEVVERQRARQAYEDFLHRRQDPALLEQEAGNEFSARVFPIPARGRKELIVSYSHALPRADQPYVLPLVGLPEVGRLDVRVLLGDRPAAAATAAPASNLGGTLRDRRMVEVHERDWTPDHDLVIAQVAFAGRRGLRSGGLTVVRLAPAVDPRPQEIAGLYVLVDSSASRALGYETELRRLGELVDGLRAGAGGDVPLAVAAFDQEVAPVFEGRSADFGAGELRRLAERRALGASDLGAALGWLAARLGATPGRYPRVLLIGDGVATAGETDGRALRAAVQALGEHGVERLDVLAVGGLRDDAILAQLAAGNLPHDGSVIDGGAPLAEIGRRLTLACTAAAVSVEGAEWVWPERLTGLQPGDEALVYAQLPAAAPLRVRLDGRPVELAGEIVAAERPLVARALAQARIERLLHLRETAMAGDEDLRRALLLQVVELSVQQRVLSPYTALLVLETEDDYRRFGLDRRALANVLTVGPGGLEVVARDFAALPPATAPLKRAMADAATAPSARRIPATGDEEALRIEPSPGPPGELGGETAGEAVARWAGADARAAEPPEIPAPRMERSRRQEGATGAAAPVPLPDPLPEPGASAGVAEEIVVSGERRRTGRSTANAPADEPIAESPPAAAPWSGPFAEVMEQLAAGRTDRARAVAERWSAEVPADVLALLALGEAWEAAGELPAAARAYGSLIDLFPARADLRRLAGERLERLGEAGLALAVDSYRKAVAQRPDHPSGHRLLAWALWRSGDLEGAFTALETGLARDYPAGRFAGVERVMQEDLGLLAAAWLAAEPGRRDEVRQRLDARGARLARAASLRFVLTWETDANDVDLHVFDRRGGHAWYQERRLPSGGELYADVTTGYGPECFTVPDPAGRGAAPYRLQAHYYSRGPMGYGMGTLQVVAHDGRGGLRLEPRPFVVMNDQAMVDLGTVEVAKAR